MEFSHLFFDLDGTLYTNNNGIWQAIKQRIGMYLTEIMGFSEEEQITLREKYYQLYGTTLRGLQIHHNVDIEDYLSFVHDIPLEKYLSYDEELYKLITTLPQKKWIFTNADEAHARRVISILGLEGCFDGIIDIHKLNYICKPCLFAYQRALEIAGNPCVKNCMFFDDSLRNLIPANNLGMTTVLVGNIEDKPEQIQNIKFLNSLHNLKQEFPYLWS